MSQNGSERRPAVSTVAAIKETIQSLAHQLWVEKHDALDGIDWLVDGRLTAQLDELSKSELLRVRRLLEQQVAQAPSGKRHMTAGSPGAGY